MTRPLGETALAPALPCLAVCADGLVASPALTRWFSRFRVASHGVWTSSSTCWAIAAVNGDISSAKSRALCTCASGRLASGCGCVCCRLSGGRCPKAQGSRRQARARRRFCGLSASLRVAARTPLATCRAQSGVDRRSSAVVFLSAFNNQRRMQQQRVCGIRGIEPLLSCPKSEGWGMQC